MPTGVFTRTEKMRKNIGLGHIGNKSRTGQKNSEITRKRISEGLKGHLTTEETKEKLREAMSTRKQKFGYINSKEARLKMSEAKKGKPNPRVQGSNCHFWKGGISFEPYSLDWTNTLRQSIRQRDNYTCFICGKEPSIYVHHIDYNKKNCNPDNLITLCHSCHSKTSFKRKHWIEFFKKVLLPKEVDI